MKLTKKISKILAKEIWPIKDKPYSEKFKESALAFVEIYGIEVASNILGIPASKLSAWKRVYKKDK